MRASLVSSPVYGHEKGRSSSSGKRCFRSSSEASTSLPDSDACFHAPQPGESPIRRYAPAAWRTSTNHTGTRTSTVHRLPGVEPGWDGRPGARSSASLYELPPGASSFPLHIHHANEELIIVLSGRPTLRGLPTFGAGPRGVSAPPGPLMSLASAKVAPPPPKSRRLFQMSLRGILICPWVRGFFLACGAKSSAASTGTMISPLGTKRCSGTYGLSRVIGLKLG